MIEKDTEESLLPYLAVCVTFYYIPERLSYLATVISNYIGIADRTDIYIVTNIADTHRIADALPSLPDNISLQFAAPTLMGHPFFLAWSHRDIFKKILADGEATHFLYSEDDLLLTRKNVMYWLRYRKPLQKHGLIPSFFRVEMHPEKGWVSTDCRSRVRLHRQPRLILEDGTQFISIRTPYQGMYFLDRPLMEEFAASPAMSPDFGRWKIRARASAGLTFVNIPPGYTSRILTLFDPDTKTIPPESWIHHLPNNYANDPNSVLGNLPMKAHGLFRGGYVNRIKQFLLQLMRNNNAK